MTDQLLDQVRDLAEGQIDFEGQRLAEFLTNRSIGHIWSNCLLRWLLQTGYQTCACLRVTWDGFYLRRRCTSMAILQETSR
ncbi:hypothetical protein EYC84_003649 [Monilinia fructicola]|nr:hypothetical protein EYC84_003649 [Monilinia fructicola]